MSVLTASFLGSVFGVVVGLVYIKMRGSQKPKPAPRYEASQPAYGHRGSRHAAGER